ncbi:MAG: hypothetical protein HBSAPP03_12530 [Phycisphaerae bacterium]|nr:MAG: hypothetical protein HBSAPP03_12530 [Phycisphaerae bacterium]
MPTPPPPSGFQPLALLGAAIFPGLGHVLGKDPKRGACVALGVLGLFFGGILIGGIDVIDSKEDRVWFYGQALVGPVAFGVDYLHQSRFKVHAPGGVVRSAYPTEGRDPTTGAPVVGGRPPNTKSIGKMNEIGTLFATIAGMMNLIAVIDAGFPVSRTRKT